MQALSQKLDLDHREVTRRAIDFSHVLQIFTFLHLHPGSTIEQISQTLKLSPVDVKDTLGDLYWGGWVLMDNENGLWPVPVFPFAPLVFWFRQLSGSTD